MASQPRDHLDRLPAELLCLVAKDNGLMSGDLAALAATCRKCYASTNPILYQKHLKEDGGQALMWAVACDRFTTITRFLENGADINNDRMFRAHVNKLTGWSVVFEYHELSIFTPLALAASIGSDSMVQFLLDHGADIEKAGKGLCACCDGENISELGFPPYKGRGNVLDADYMMEDDAEMCWTPLHFALCRGHESTAMTLLERGASPQVTCPCSDGPWSALHTATRLNQLKVINYILDNRLVDVNAKAHEGMTPLLVAFYEEQYSLVDLYIDQGADINAVWHSNDGGWTIFGMACLREDFSRASDLLRRGADPDLNLRSSEYGDVWTALGLVYGNLFGKVLRTFGCNYEYDRPTRTGARRALEEQIIQTKVDRALQQRQKEDKD